MRRNGLHLAFVAISACGGSSGGVDGGGGSGDAADVPHVGLRVTLHGDGVGTVTSEPAGIDCPDVCFTTFPVGAQVTFTATPGPRSTFVNWGAVDAPSDRCPGASCTIEIKPLDGEGGINEVHATFDQPSTLGLCLAPATGPVHKSVMSRVKFPQNNTQVNTFGLDLDGDPQGTTDNQLGSFFNLLAQQCGLNIFQSHMDAAVANGSALHVLALQADDLMTDADPTSFATPYWATSSGPPDFSGSGSFTALANPSDMHTCGGITSGRYRGYGGGERTVQLRVSLLGSLATLPLRGAVLNFDTTGGCVSGSIGGGLTPDALDSVLGVLAGAFNSHRATAPTSTEGQCAAGIDQVFGNNDGIVQISELKGILGILEAPDVDLFVGSVYDPRIDGVKDSHSIGLGFDCVGASFAIP